MDEMAWMLSIWMHILIYSCQVVHKSHTTC